MKQHILEHWIKLAQEIQDGLENDSSYESVTTLQNELIDDIYDSINVALSHMTILKANLN